MHAVKIDTQRYYFVNDKFSIFCTVVFKYIIYNACVILAETYTIEGGLKESYRWDHIKNYQVFISGFQ